MGFCGLFFFQDYVRKISALSISYTSFLILITFIAIKSQILNEILTIMVSVLVIFSVNLLVGIGIARNIAENSANQKKNSA
jgi:hypothetical protein